MGMIKFENVEFRYPNGFLAVENLNFDIEKGENAAIVGQNGAGKTTTVKMMNGLLKPTGGIVLTDGMDTRNYTTAQLSRKVGYVFQNPDDQIFHNTVGDEIRFGPKVLGHPSEKVEELTRFAAELVHLDKHLEENPYNFPLSVRKFVTIASVLAMDTEVVILDEPTAGQDLYGIRLLEEMLAVLQKRGKTIITITHDMEFVAKNFDSVYVMANKHLLQKGSAEEVFDNDAILKESMLKRPFISDLARQLNLEKNVTRKEELVEILCKRYK